jgi:hypothetical protein
VPTLVHLTPESNLKAIRRSGLAPTRLGGWHARYDRFVWAFPVLESYTLTHQWMRELKRHGARTLAAVRIRIPDDEPVLVGHFREARRTMSAAEAVGLVRNAESPLGYEIMIPRRIAPHEIVDAFVPRRAVGWRYYPEVKAARRYPCDCPVCMPRGEVKAARYRRRIGDIRQRWELTRTRLADRDRAP